MDALIWISHIFWLGFIGAGILVLLIWIAQVLRFVFRAGSALATALLSEAMTASEDIRPGIVTGPVGGITAGEGT